MLGSEHRGFDYYGSLVGFSLYIEFFDLPGSGKFGIRGVSKSQLNFLAVVSSEIGRSDARSPRLTISSYVVGKVGPFATFFLYLEGASSLEVIETTKEVSSFVETKFSFLGLREVDNGRNEPTFGC